MVFSFMVGLILDTGWRKFGDRHKVERGGRGERERERERERSATRKRPRKRGEKWLGKDYCGTDREIIIEKQ